MSIAYKELKRLRLSLGLTQKQLAESISISSARYSSWERGEKQPSTVHLQALATNFNCSVSKLIDSSDGNDSDSGYFDDRHPSFSYFVHERQEEKGDTHYLLILKLSIFEHPMIFELSYSSREKTLRAITNGGSDFIWVETFNDKMFYINTDCIEWTILHNDDSDEYPLLSGNNFHETPLTKADVTKDAVLFMMAKNGNCEGNSEYYLSMDFEWLIRNKSRLIKDIPIVVNSLQDSLQGEYIEFVNDTKKTMYEKEFINAWGIRITLKNGKEIFLPGMSVREEGWDDVLIDIKNMNLYDGNNVTIFSDYENSNQYMIPTKEIALIEYPNIFEGMGLYAQFEGIEELTYDDIDSVVQNCYELIWGECNKKQIDG